MKCFWVFSTFAVGGPQRRFASLVEALGTDFTHTVTAIDGRYGAENLLTPNIAYRRYEMKVGKGSFLSSKNIERFRATLLSVKPDILITSNWGTIEWRIANRTPKVPHLHLEDGFGPDETSEKRKVKRDIARRLLFSRLGTGHRRFAFAAPSSGLTQILKTAWGAAPSRVHFIPNGADIGAFVSHLSETTLPVIGSVGALRPEKRFDRLLRIFAAVLEHREARLIIVGDGPLLHDLRNLAKQLGVTDSVEFAGERKDVAALMQRMNIYALTSDTEQMPISVIEAMASHLPVVSGDVGDVKCMIAASNSPFLHSYDDETNMARSIISLIDQPERRAEIGKANAEKARQDYSLAAMTSRYRDVFQKLIAWN